VDALRGADLLVTKRSESLRSDQKRYEALGTLLRTSRTIPRPKGIDQPSIKNQKPK
jgi:hypothetical protein